MNCITPYKKFRYDPRCRDWYQGANQSSEVFYTSPYQSVDGQIMLSAAIKIQDDKDNNYQVLGFDLGVEQFIHQDLASKKSDEYTIVFDQESKILYHQCYDTSIQSVIWSDLEYQNTTTLQQKSDKRNFKLELNKTINYLVKENHNSQSQNYTFKFQKNEKEYFALILPVEQMKNSFLANNKSSILFLGRVLNDLTTVFKKANIANNNTLIIINLSGIFFTIVLNILAFAIFVIYQYYIILIPLSTLTTFLKEAVSQREEPQDNIQIRQKKDTGINTLKLQNEKSQSQHEQVLQSRNNISSSQIASSQGFFLKSESKDSAIINRISKKSSDNQSSPQVNQKNLYQLEKSVDIQIQEQSTSKQQEYTDSLLSEESIDLEEYRKLDLQNLVPFSLEIEIIKETFLKLEQILNFTHCTNENSKNQDQQFLEIFYGISIFKDIKNYFAIQKLYSELGRIYFDQKEYSIALQKIQSSLHYCLLDLGFGDEQIFWISFNSGVYSLNSEKMYTLSIRYYMVAFYQFQMLIQNNKFIQNQFSYLYYPEEQSLLKNSYQNILKCLTILDKIENTIIFNQTVNNQANFIFILASQIGLLMKNETIYLKYYPKIDFDITFPTNLDSPQIRVNSQKEPLMQQDPINLIQNYGQQQIIFLNIIKSLANAEPLQIIIDQIKDIFEESQFIYPQLFSLCFDILKHQLKQVPEMDRVIEEEKLNIFKKFKYNFIIIIQIENYSNSLDMQKKIFTLQQLYQRTQNFDTIITLIIYSQNQFETIQAYQPIQDAKHFSILMESLHSRFLALKNRKLNEKMSNFFQSQDQSHVMLQNFILESITQLCSVSENEYNNYFTQNIVILDRLEVKLISEKEYFILQNLQFFSEVSKVYQYFILTQNCNNDEFFSGKNYDLINLTPQKLDHNKTSSYFKFPFRKRIIISRLEQLIPCINVLLINKIKEKSIELNQVFE